MRRHLVVVVAVLLAAATSVDARDRGPAADVERIAVQIEELYGHLLGPAPERPTFRALDDGLSSLTWKLSESAVDRYHTLAKDTQVLSNGHQVSDPNGLSGLINAVLSDLETDYNFWFVVLNFGSDADRKVTNTVKGPGPNYKRVDELTFAGGSIQLFWFEIQDAYDRFGVFTHKTKANQSGSAKSKALAQ
ncbi:MAG: hypothetical protein R3325_01460 [Thermoanaerobaculia bacterium]|nr:hypothetical protein [Thermoanaerobaculia bacterium]